MDLESRLCSSLPDFIKSTGTPSLDKFVGELDTLHQQLAASTSLPRETVQLAYEVSGCLDILCETFMNLTRIDDDLNSRVEEFFSSAHNESTTPEREEDRSSIPPYAKAAHEWLLENLHNPFPSPQIIENIRTPSNSSEKHVKTWFNEIRKKIGWNAIRRDHFKSRKEMVDAASTFLLEDKQPLTPAFNGEVGNKLVQMQTIAKELYQKRFGPSELMQKLDKSVRTMSTELKREADADKREQQLKKRRVAYKREELDKAAPFVFHSTGTIQKMAQAGSTQMAGQKRRSREDEDEPSHKRKRHQDDSETESSSGSSRRASSLFSDDGASTITDLTTPASSPSPCSSSSQLPSLDDPTPRRKRRLSESDGSQSRATKRARHVVGRSSSAPAAPISLPNLPFPAEQWFDKLPPTSNETSFFELGNTECSLFDIGGWLSTVTDLSDGDSTGSSSGVTTPTDQTVALPSIVVSDGQDYTQSYNSSVNPYDVLYGLGASSGDGNLTLPGDYSTTKFSNNSLDIFSSLGTQPSSLEPLASDLSLLKSLPQTSTPQESSDLLDFDSIFSGIEMSMAPAPSYDTYLNIGLAA